MLQKDKGCMNKKIGNDEAKRIMLDILLSFANYCDDNCLRYYLAYGTLIGAVRHKPKFDSLYQIKYA